MNNVYIKDFDLWNQRKKILDALIQPAESFFLEREIWWTALGVNVGSEIDGKHHNFERPAIVLKKFSHNTLWMLPISKTEKRGDYFYHIKHKGESRTVLLLQMRLISSKRLLRLIGRIEETDFNAMKDSIVKLLNKSDSPLSPEGISVDITET